MSDFLFPHFTPFELSQLRIYSRFWRDVIRPRDIWRCLEYKIRNLLNRSVLERILYDTLELDGGDSEIPGKVILSNIAELAAKFGLILSGSAILSCFYGTFKHNDLDFYICESDYEKHKKGLYEMFGVDLPEDYFDLGVSLFDVISNGNWTQPKLQLVITKIPANDFIKTFDFDICRNSYHCGERKLYINSPANLLAKFSSFEFVKVPLSAEIYHRIRKYHARGFEFPNVKRGIVDFHRKFAFAAGEPTQILRDFITNKIEYYDKSEDYIVWVPSPIIIYFEISKDIATTRDIIIKKESAFIKYCDDNGLSHNIFDIGRPEREDEKIEYLKYDENTKDIYYIKKIGDSNYFSDEFHTNLPIISNKLLVPLLPMYRNTEETKPYREFAMKEFGFDSDKKVIVSFNIICIPRIE